MALLFYCFMAGRDSTFLRVEPTQKSRFGQKLPDFKNLAVLVRSENQLFTQKILVINWIFQRN